MTTRRRWFLAGMVVVAAVALVAAWHARKVTLRQAEIDALCAKLIDPDTSVRQAAADKLAAVRDPAGIRRMAIHMGIGDPNIGGNVTFILGRIGAPAVEPVAYVSRKACAGYGVQQFPWNITWMKPWHALWLGLPKGTDVDRWRESAHSFVVQALANIGRPAKPTIFKMMADPDPNVREIAWDALGPMRDPRDFDRFLEMASDTDPAVASCGLEGLWYLEMTRTGRIGRNPNADDDAAWQVCGARRDEAVKAILSSLKSKNPRVRESAVRGLGEYHGNAAAAEAALKIAQDHSEQPSMRALVACGLLESSDSRPVLIGMLGDADRELRNEIAGILPYGGDTAATVAPALDSTDAAMRDGAASYFIQTSHPENIRFISDAYGSFSPSGRQNAKATLRKISAGVFSTGSQHPDIVRTRAELQKAAREALAKLGLDSSGTE